MDHTQLWHDITSSVEHALTARLADLSEEWLVARSDTLLAMLPGVSGAQPLTTAAFLQHNDTALYHELCRGTRPLSTATSVAGQLHDLTRAVLVSSTAQGLSIEAALGIALVLQTRGLAQFCALPMTPAASIVRAKHHGAVTEPG